MAGSQCYFSLVTKDNSTPLTLDELPNAWVDELKLYRPRDLSVLIRHILGKRHRAIVPESVGAGSISNNWRATCTSHSWLRGSRKITFNGWPRTDFHSWKKINLVPYTGGERGRREK